MSFFPFIEGIFYLSLGIIIVLIFLIVFHFKQRIETLEKKSFLFTEMYNNLVKELNIMKTFMYSPPSIQQKQNIVFSTIPNEVTETDSNMNNYKKIIVMDKINEDEEEDDEEEDEEDEDEEEEDEEEDENDDAKNEYEDEVDNEKKEYEYIPIESIDLSMEEPIQIEKELELELEPIQVIKMEQEQEQEPTISYTKLNLNELKTLAISKGLSTNPNKMKRAELLKLLEETI